MSQVVIENPIINSPFDEPNRHFQFGDEGITNEIIDGRRTSSYFVPIAKAKKKGSKQLQFETEWTQDRIEFLADGQRVELNAMDSAQFIAWLERKLEEHGVKKLIPEKAVLESVYKLAILTGKANEAIAKVQSEWNENGHVEMPADLEDQIRNLMIEKPELPWDQAVSRVASPPDEEEAATIPSG